MTVFLSTRVTLCRTQTLASRQGTLSKENLQIQDHGEFHFFVLILLTQDLVYAWPMALPWEILAVIK